MASSHGSRTSAKGEIKQQDIKQAVVIADNFNDRFLPLTISKPAVLLPVVNGVLLDYVLQSLEECGVQETFIFCCAHNQQIRTYISSSRWAETDSAMSSVVISSSTFMSMGDILRELDSKALIRSDFILIRGDVIFNIPLSDILEEHKKRRLGDKGCAITLVYRKALPDHKTRCQEDDFLVAVESTSQRIRYYKKLNKERSFNIPLEVFQENEEVCIYYDLLNTHISICSPCVPPLFSDNFDYQSLDDFVKGLIVNEELLGNSMYIHIAKSGYGASLSNLYMYDAVSQDILSRWTYPVVPDLFRMNVCKYSYSRHNIYKAPNIDIGRNCVLKQNVAIAAGTKIGNNCYISNSVIGKNCTIGDNVEIKGSYLWSGVTVGDNCKIDTCLLAEDVILYNKVILKAGCVLGREVIIGDCIVLKEFTKLQAQASYDDSFGEDDFGEQEKTEDKEKRVSNPELVGINGHGFECVVLSESDDDDEGMVDVWGKPPDDYVYDDDDSLTSSSEILCSEEICSEISGDDYDDDTALFYAEVLESLQRAVEERVKSENLILEINSSKHAYNVTIKEVNTALIKAILRIPLENQEPNAQQYLAAMKKNLIFFQSLISNYVKSIESQLDCLLAIEEFMMNNESLAPAVIKVIHFWYDKDVLNESVILRWFHNIKRENIKTQASGFIQWLQEADEESSDD